MKLGMLLVLLLVSAIFAVSLTEAGRLERSTDRNTCIDTYLKNSGRSANVCPAAPHDESTCSLTVCDCCEGWANCDDISDNGCETHTLSDPNNCGGCGIRCPTGVACEDGKCACPIGETYCNGACVDISSDIKNCGGCGSHCGKSPYPYETICDDGTCKSQCTLTQCGTYCVDPSSDVLNCGTCGHSCYLSPSGGVPTGATQVGCSKGSCTIVSCIGETADCDGIFANGCEVDLTSNPDNCGRCGNRCPTNRPNCVEGSCVAPA